MNRLIDLCAIVSMGTMLLFSIAIVLAIIAGMLMLLPLSLTVKLIIASVIGLSLSYYLINLV